MELINDRYRVIKNNFQNQLVSSYVVVDLFRENKKINLNILNPEVVPQELLDYYMNEFLVLTNINSSRIVKLHKFGVVNSFDGKHLQNNQYYYTRDFIDEGIDYSEFVKQANRNDIMDCFIQICQAINYMHLKGFIYREINLNNIYFKRNEDSFEVQVKDLATTELEKQMYWLPKNYQYHYKAPEVLSDALYSERSDIFSLGVLLLMLFQGINLDNFDVKKAISDLPHNKLFENEKKLGMNLACIIEKMTCKNPTERYEFVYDVVEDINKVLDKQYRTHIKDEMENIIFKTRLIGREKEIKKIIQAYYSIENGQATENVLLIHGDHGIGKTRILQELRHFFTIKNAEVCSIFDGDYSVVKDNKLIIDIVKQFLPRADAETMEHYGQDIARIIPGIDTEGKISYMQEISGEREKFYFFNRIDGFLKECIKSRPLVFILDNIHLADSFTLEFFDYVSSILDKKRILIIASYCDKECDQNDLLSEIISKLGSNSQFEDISLGGLTIDDTIKMVKSILSLPNDPIQFSTRIYTETYGNPLFIEEVIKNLFTEGYIYINDDGRWHIGLEDYDKLPIPSSIYQAVFNQLKNLDKESYEILKIISIFNTPVSIETVSSILSIDEIVIDSKFETMIRKGLLDKKVEDWGYAYDLHNRGVKELIYSDLSDDERRERHRLAAVFLENQYKKESRGNKEELIYHLEKAEEKNKVVEYCLETADQMEAIQIKSESLKSLGRALRMFGDEDCDKRRIQILMRIGDIHNDEGRNIEAVKYYEKIISLLVNKPKNTYYVDTLNKLAEIYILRNELEKTLDYISAVDEYLKDFEYERGFAESRFMLASVYYNKQDYKGVIDICEKGIALCHDKYLDIEGKLRNQLGIIHMETSKVEEALEDFETCVKLFERCNYTKGILRSLNNLGVIYGDYFQDVEKSIEYFLRMKDIAERNNIINSQILAESNIAECYIDMENYYGAMEYYKNSLELSKKIDYESFIFNCYVSLTKICIKVYEYKNAYDYYTMAVKEFERYPIQRRTHIGDFHKVEAMLYYTFGDIPSAEVAIKKALDIYANDDFKIKWECDILDEYIKISKSKDRDFIAGCIERVRVVASKYELPTEKANILYKLVMIANGINNDQLAHELVAEAESACISIKSDKIEVKRLYTRAIISKDMDLLAQLELSLELAKKEKLKKWEWNIYTTLGNYYFFQKQYYDSTRYYFEACEVIKKLAMEIPEQYRLGYIKGVGKLKPFEMLMRIKHIYNKYYDADTSILQSISTLDQLNNLLGYKDFWDILTNRNFVKTAEKSYNMLLPKNIRTANDIMRNLCYDSTTNLCNLIRIMARDTLATRGYIILIGDNHETSVIASLDGSLELPNMKYLFERVNTTGSPLFITESKAAMENGDINLMPKGAKAVICIPVLKGANPGTVQFEDDRRKENQRVDQVIGYIYLDSDRLLNNFNRKNFVSCIELTGLTRLVMENYRLKIISSIDKLTGSFTRKHMVDSLTEEFSKASEKSGYFSIIMFDIDKFKSINDRFGHQKGDDVLKEICRIVQKNIRKEDSLCRYGGEEFIVILPDTASAEAGFIAEKLRIKIQDARILGDKYPVTVSIGVAAYPEHGQIEQELVEKVDQALYVAKESGRNRSQVWNTQISNKTKRKDRLAGIVSGNAIQDYRNVLAMIELIELVKEAESRDEKIYKLLGRIIEITEAQYGMLFVLDEGEIVQKYGRKKFEDEWVEVKKYNNDILANVINEKQGIYRVDWDDIMEYDVITGSPDWQSVIAVPLIESQKIKGVLYLTVSTKIKEFDFNHFNFVNTLGDITAAIL